MKNLVLFNALFFYIFAYTQNNLSKIDKEFLSCNYQAVIVLAETQPNINADESRKLAYSYKMMGEYEKAEAAYQKLSQENALNPDDIYQYAQILKMNGKYDESASQMQNYYRLKNKIQKIKTLDKLMAGNKGYEINNENINTPYQDFGITFFQNNLVFGSVKKSKGSVYRTFNPYKLPALDLYLGSFNDSANIKQEVPFKNINKHAYTGLATYSPDGKLMIFAEDYFYKENNDIKRIIKLYQSQYNNGKWSKKNPLNINSNNYSLGQPCLNHTADTLYFASNMEGGYGGTDIYRSYKQADGTWSKPENLGPRVNTQGDEMFPFIHPSGLLFFASDGHVGLGGLDIFVTELNSKNQYKSPVNLGSPINTSKDDYNFILNNEKTKAWFSSNREGGKGEDDIYSCHVKIPIKVGKEIKGIVKNNTGEILSSASITLLDEQGNIIEEIQSDEQGFFSYLAEEDKTYKIKANKEKHFELEKIIRTETDEDEITNDLILEKDPGLMFLAYIKDRSTGKPMQDVKINFLDNITGESIVTFTGDDGQWRKLIFDKKLNDEMKYQIILEKQGYLRKIINYYGKITKPGNLVDAEDDFYMDVVEVGKDLAKMIDLKPIYFDAGKFNIRKDAAAELDKIVKIMNDYPNMVVELGAHTDCRGAAKSNLALSQKRAKSSADYIKKRITNPNRINGKGYGESKLLNNCACEGKTTSNCTEEEHQLNRRTEFIIIKL
jgi:outer membrane protein OmpA-like peptidoglycan-associated protein